MRLIDADVLLEKVREIRKLALDRAVETPANMPFPIYQNPAYTRYSTQAGEREKFKAMIEEAPTIQPKRPTGEWIQKPRYEDDEYPDAQPNLKCPFCGYEIGWCDMGNYCARCGADLKGGAE